jgi:hypothetical protein
MGNVADARERQTPLTGDLASRDWSKDGDEQPVDQVREDPQQLAGRGWLRRR